MKNYLEFSKRDLKGIFSLLILVLILLFAPWVLNLLFNGGRVKLDYADLKEISSSDKRMKEGSAHADKGRIHLNQATADDLRTIPGLSLKNIYNILSYRKRNGDFTDIRELKNAGLTDEQTYDQISTYLVL